MNKKWYFSGLLACLVTVGLLVVSCDNPSGGNPPGGDPPGGGQYTVTYNGNGADRGTVPKSQTVNAGDSVTAAAQGDLAKDGFVFSVWNTADDGSGTEVIPGASYKPSADVTLYAQWQDPEQTIIKVDVFEDPVLLDQTVTMTKGESKEFTVPGSYQSYQWYLKGNVITGATVSAYTLNTTTMTVGIHELAVVVTQSNGQKLSGRCRITITAEE